MARPFHNRKRRGGTASKIRRVDGPGKFEGEDYTALWAYEVMLHGGGSEECSAGDGGPSYSLLLGPFSPATLDYFRAGDEPLNRAERRFIRKHAGCILHERSDGFVGVAWFLSVEFLEGSWNNLVEVLTSDHEEEDEELEEEEVVA